MLAEVQGTLAAFILIGVLAVFTLGKSPVFRVDRAGAAIIGASLMMVFGILSFSQAVSAIDHRTLVVLFSMMVVVANLKVAGFFSYLGEFLLQTIKTKRGLLFTVIFVSGGLSAIAINDIVCLLFTSVVLMVCQRGKVNPVPHLLGLAMASNIGSAATFLGNPQNILIGSLSGIPLLAYLIKAFPLAFIGLFLLYWFLCWQWKWELQGCLRAEKKQTIRVHRYLVMKAGTVMALIIGGYLAGFDLALLASLGAAVLLVTRRIKPNRIYESIDFNLLLIFIGLFVIVGGIRSSGLLAEIFSLLPLDQIQALPVFAFLTVAFSNLVSNVPAVLLLQYAIPSGSAMHWEALAVFSTIAGNLTIFGSVANLIVVEIAKKQNVMISSRDYMKTGIPVTLLLSVIAVFWL